WIRRLPEVLQNLSRVAKGGDSRGDQADRRKDRLRVAILGSSGGMGSLLARYFISKGHIVVGFDPSKGRKPVRGLKLQHSNQSAAEAAKLVLLEPPVYRTLQVADE